MLHQIAMMIGNYLRIFPPKEINKQLRPESALGHGGSYEEVPSVRRYRQEMERSDVPARWRDGS